MSEWFRMDDPDNPAPRDGTRVMLWRTSAEVGVRAEIVFAEWFEGSWCWPRETHSIYGRWTKRDLMDGYWDGSFTHWQPLPEPPK